MKKTTTANGLFDKKQLKWFRTKLLSWSEKNLRVFPWRITNNTYEILIAEMLLQATSATKVAEVYDEFIRRYPNPKLLAAAERNDVERIIRSLGLLNRAQALMEVGRVLLTVHGGLVPKGKDELLRLPRVGDYTAGAVLSFGYGFRAGIPDTNVIRLLQRFFGLTVTRKSHRGSPSQSMRRAAHEVVPKSNSRHFNYGMLDFGSLVCTSVRPKCASCPLNNHCNAYRA